MKLSKIDPLDFVEKVLLFLAILTAVSGLTYYLFDLGRTAVIAAAVLAAAVFIILQKTAEKHNSAPPPAAALTPDNQKLSPDKKSLWTASAAVLYLAVFAGGLWILYSGGTEKPITSPWEALPSSIFYLYFAASVLLYANLRLGRAKPFFLILHAFFSWSVIIFVYRLGFGYDFFVHQATLRIIAERGLVLPKHFYYLGHYGLLMIFRRLLGLSLFWTQQLLVPVAAALFLPPLAYRTISARFKNFKPSWLVFLFAFPLPFLTFTTPYNFALFFLLAALLAALREKNVENLIFVWALALAAMAVHPLAGFPALLLAAGSSRPNNIATGARRVFDYLIFSAAALGLPLAFYLLEPGADRSGNWSLAQIVSWISPSLAGRSDLLSNFAYFFYYNLPLAVATLAVWGLWLSSRAGRFRDFSACASIAAGLAVAALLTRFLPFSYLVEYERSDFAERLLVLSALFLAPFIISALERLFSAIAARGRVFKAAWLVFGLFALLASWYFTYPRLDKYQNSRGLSIGAADIEAVRWIEQDASGAHIVLANQQTSAAALREFGFSRYYKNDLFYYPIPTSGPLYQYYLSMVYKKPSRETMRQALDLAGVKEGYFVLNKYWADFPRILAEAKFASDRWQSFSNGEIYVFSYSLTK